MTNDRRVSYGWMGIWLVFAWTLTSATLSAAFWTLGEHSFSRALAWFFLWLFTVALPTRFAFLVHRRVSELTRGPYNVPEPVLRDLRNARWAFLMLGSVSVLNVVAVMFELIPPREW